MDESNYLEAVEQIDILIEDIRRMLLQHRIQEAEQSLMVLRQSPVIERMKQEEVTLQTADIVYLQGSISFRHGDNDDALAYFHQAKKQYALLNNIERVARALTGIAMSLINKQQDDDVADIIDEMLHNYSDKISSFTQANLLCVKGIHCARKQDIRMAMELYQQANSILQIDDIYKTDIYAAELYSALFNNIGSIYNNKGEYDKAIEAFKTSLQYAKEHHFLHLEAKVLSNLGLAYHNIGDTTIAEEYYLSAETLLRTIEDKYSLAILNLNMGRLYKDIGQITEAIRYYNIALDMFTAMNDESGKARVYLNFGVIYARVGDFSKALDYFVQAKNTFERTGNTSGLAGVMRNIANMYAILKDNNTAIEWYHRALALEDALERKLGVAENAMNLGTTYFDMVDYDHSLEWLEFSLAVHSEIGNKQGFATVMSNIGRTYLAKEDYAKAEEYLHKASVLLEDVDIISEKALVMIWLGKLYSTPKYNLYNSEKAELYLLEAGSILHEIQHKGYLGIWHRASADFYLQMSNIKNYSEHIEMYIALQEDSHVSELENNLRDIEYRRRLNVMEQQYSAERALERARLEALQDMLYRTMPASVAERVLKGETVADTITSATPMFIDIVGFTTLSAQLGVRETLLFLESLFVEIDDIIATEQIEKIKTLGDGYLAVSGLPLEMDDHALRAARAAIAIMNLSDNPQLRYTVRQAGLDTLQMRIGLHSGKVVAGVIGREKMLYDVYGDAINTASRMESHGKPGQIHVSAEFKDHFLAQAQQFENVPEVLFVPRGKIEIKGKGYMETFFMQFKK